MKTFIEKAEEVSFFNFEDKDFEEVLTEKEFRKYGAKKKRFDSLGLDIVGRPWGNSPMRIILEKNHLFLVILISKKEHRIFVEANPKVKTLEYLIKAFTDLK